MEVQVPNPTMKKAKGNSPPKRGQIKTQIFEDFYKLLTTLALIAAEKARGSGGGGGGNGGEGGSAPTTLPPSPAPDGRKISIRNFVVSAIC